MNNFVPGSCSVVAVDVDDGCANILDETRLIKQCLKFAVMMLTACLDAPPTYIGLIHIVACQDTQIRISQVIDQVLMFKDPAEHIVPCIQRDTRDFTHLVVAAGEHHVAACQGPCCDDAIFTDDMFAVFKICDWFHRRDILALQAVDVFKSVVDAALDVVMDVFVLFGILVH